MNVHVIGRFPPPSDGQTLATQRMSELVARHHHINRISTEPPPSEYVENEVTFRWRRVRHYLGMRNTIRTKLSTSPSAPVLWASISPALLGHVRDIVTVASAFVSNQPVAGIIHRTGYDRLFRSSFTRPSARWLARRLSAFVFLNERQSAACASWIPEPKRFVIPNTVDRHLLFDPSEIASKRSDRRAKSELRLLFLSNMIPLKGYIDVLKAAAVLRMRNVRFQVDFVGRWGSDDDRRTFERQVDALQLRQSVHYHGGVEDRAAVRTFFVHADVFVLPTYHPTEAQPVALIEAMSAGVPIITTRQGGIPSMLSDPEAFFVSSRSPAEIADAVEQLVDADTWTTFSRSSREAFERTFSPDIVEKQWNALVERMASR
ncbi:MAG: glycosyltransferase family 4 protein [Rhodothermales bacterium]